MKNLCALSDLEPGEGAVVSRLLSSGSIRRRLKDLGIIEGTYVECMLRSPGGDPCAYRIRGATIALRCDDAENVIVSLSDNI